MNIELIGERELKAILSQLPKKVNKSLLVRAFKKAAKPLIVEAKALTPVSHKKSFIVAHADIKKGIRSTKLVKHRAGELKRSIGLIVGRGPVAAVYVGPRRGGVKANDGWYANFVEFGTVKQKAQPFMRPAWQRTHARIEETIEFTIKAEVRKVVAKYAKAI